ncbi:MAG: hypothetical protein ABJP71_13630 [Erythrobacter sp.]
MINQKRFGVTQLDFRAGVAELMDSLRPDYFVTLVFNRTTGLHSAARRVERFQAMVDRKLLGTRWLLKVSLRTQYIAVAEHQNSNLHFHCVFLVPHRLTDFPAIAEQAWHRLAPAGNIDIQPYRSDGAAQYSAKLLRPAWSDLISISPNASNPYL